MSSGSDLKRELLRHTVATLAYRGAKTLRDAPATFTMVRISEKTRTPAEVLAHIGDLLDWALSLAKGQHVWNGSTPLPWEKEVTRFFAALKSLDDYLASDRPLGFPVEKLFQGPVADALTHVGQIAMLRRIAGEPIRGENYSVAKIEAGRIGAEQPEPLREFD